MENVKVIDFINLFDLYCDEVRSGIYPKIEYGSWGTINKFLKELENSPTWCGDTLLYLSYEIELSYNQEATCKLNIRALANNKCIEDVSVPTDFINFIINQGANIACNIYKEENKMSTTIPENLCSNRSLKSCDPNPKTQVKTNLIPSFDFGPISDGTVRVSPYGMAIKNNDEAWVSYNPTDGSVITVSGFTFDLGQMLFKVPVALSQIQKGDMVIHNRVPMYVTDVAAGGKQVSVVDIREGEIKTVMPPTNMFGFNFVTKVVSLINFQTSTPDPNNPFGNIMPFIFMSSMFGGENGSGMSDIFKGDFGKMMMYSMMFGGNGSQNIFGNLFGGLMPQTSQAAAPTPTIPSVPAAPVAPFQAPAEITCNT